MNTLTGFARVCFLVLAASVVSFGGLWGGEQAKKPLTGLRTPTSADRAWMDNNGVRIHTVKLNQLGMQRMNEHLRNKKIRELTAADMGGVAGVGQEVQGPRSTVTAYGDMTSAVTSASTPAAVDNSVRDAFPPIGDQGVLNSCASFSSTYYQMTYMTAFARGINAKAGGAATQFSTKFTYNMINGGTNIGTFYTDAFKIMQKHGCPTLAAFPYDGYDYAAWPTTADIWRNALSYRMDQVGSVTALNTDAGMAKMKIMLLNGYVLVFSSYSPAPYRGWQMTTVKNDPATVSDDGFAGQQISKCIVSLDWGHAMTFVGYDDSVWCDINGNGVVNPGEKGAFKVANSWGRGYANQGFCWLAYDALRTTTMVSGWTPPANKAGVYNNEAWWITAKESYTPKMVAECSVYNTSRNNLYMTLGTGDTTSPAPKASWASECISGDGGARAFSGTFVLDFTDLVNPTALSKRWFVGMRDGIAGNSSVINSFKLYSVTNYGDTLLGSCLDIPRVTDASQVYVYIDYASVVAVNHAPTLASVWSDMSLLTMPATTAVHAIAEDQDNDTLTYAWTKLSGAGTVTFANAASLDCGVSFSAAGTYVLQVAVADGKGEVATSSVSITVNPAPAPAPAPTPAPIPAPVPAPTPVPTTTAIVAPSTVTASYTVSTTTGNTVIVRWADKSTNETGFYVEVNNGSGIFSRLGTAGRNVTGYSISAVNKGTYQYRLQAYDSMGRVSAYSNVYTLVVR